MNAIEKHLYEKGRRDGLEEAARVADNMIMEVMATDPARAEIPDRIAKKIRSLEGQAVTLADGA